MHNVKLSKQIIITTENKVGTLADISNIVSSSDINLIAVSAYALGNKGVIMFVAENSKKAKKLLSAKKYNVREEEVILVTLKNKPGALQSLTKIIAGAGIDLTLLYGTVEKAGKLSQIVLIAEDNKAAAAVIKMYKTT